MKYRCILVEDNILERDSLELKLRKIDRLVVKASVSNGLEAMSLLKTGQVDIVFSDIDMPELSGLELLRSLNHPPVFIFISSHTHHAAESFELNVIDYIVKPVKLERLIKAVDKAIEYLKVRALPVTESHSKQPAASEPGQDFIRSIDAHEYFFIKENNTYIKLNMGDVLYIESMGDFSKIYTTRQKSHMVLISLKNLEKQLPPHIFMRVHKQFMINLLHIRNISSSDIKMSNDTMIPVSIAYKQSLQDNLINKKTLTRFIE